MAADAYGTIAQMQDDEARRARLNAIEYSKEDHASNPFIHGSLTKQSRLTSLSPELAEFFKTEARPVELPFGPGGNMTMRGKIARNPKLKAIADRADEVTLMWKTDERRRLESAKAEAKKRLAALK